MTAKNAAPARASGPADAAVSTLPCSSLRRLRAVLFIQKTIQVTSATAINDVTPANSSCPRSLSDTDVIVRKAPSAILARTAEKTPVHKGFKYPCRLVLTM